MVIVIVMTLVKNKVANLCWASSIAMAYYDAVVDNDVSLWNDLRF